MADPGERFERLSDLIGATPLLFWEGDAFGPGKPIPSATAWWAARSDVVFSACGTPQAEELIRLGAREVRPMPQTYDHVQFAANERELVPGDPTCRRVTMVGGYYQRIPPFGGLPGDRDRYRVARRLRRRFGSDFVLRGRGWPRRWGVTGIPFREQLDLLTSSLVTVNWDHYPSYADSSSDRLPMSLLAGRCHVTTEHPGFTWLPREEIGLYPEPDVRAVVDRVGRLHADATGTLARGQLAHRWVRHRLSDREGARHVLSTVLTEVPRPPADPWANLPRPWVPR